MSNKAKRKLFKKLIRKMDKTEGSFGLLGHCILTAGLEVPLLAHFGVINMVSGDEESSDAEDTPSTSESGNID